MMQDLAVCKGDDVILLGEGIYQGLLALELEVAWSSGGGGHYVSYRFWVFLPSCTPGLQPSLLECEL